GINLNFATALDVQHVSLSNVTATGAKVYGLNVTAPGAGTRVRDLDITDSDFSDSLGTGVSIVLDRQAVPVDINLKNVTADDAGATGVKVSLDTVLGGANNITIDHVTADGAKSGDGLNVSVTGLGAT